MKRITLTFLFLLSFSLMSNAQETKKSPKVFGKTISPDKILTNGFIRCATDEYEEYLQATNSKRKSNAEFEAWLAPLIQEYKQNQMVSSQSGSIITIPVVVHVIHNGDAYGTGENITDEQVESQITVMTQDFRRMTGTPGFNTNSVGADTQIQFALAKVDPNGNPTNGINRVNLCQPSWSTADINSIVKPATIWDPTQYMNMWSLVFTDVQLLGYAQFPDASGLQGLNPSGGAANTDGVVAGYKFFGSSSLASGAFQAPFDKGRTMTHEVGHFLGLRHIWGDGGCGVDDFCADTPVAGAANEGCPIGADTCPLLPGIDMIENYMDYTNDTCMNIFTQNQKDRMVVIMNNAPRRASLKTSTKDVVLPLFANDAEVQIQEICSESAVATCSNPNGIINKKVYLYNRGNTNLTAASLSYTTNGGAAQTQNWTGNLAPNKFAEVTLNNSQGSGLFSVSVVTANGVTDQRASNNTKTKTFNLPTVVPVPYHNYTNFVYNLVGDRYGAETTWTLKNTTGTTLYNGGPYTNLTSNGTQNLVTNQTWSLPANGCYELTVNDSYGDGIIGVSGAGYFTVKANLNTVTVINNTTFAGSKSINPFTNNATLSTEDVPTLLNDVTVFPNPTNGDYTLHFPAGLASNATVKIYNNVGQLIENRTITNEADLKFNAGNLANGIYFINVNVNNNFKTIKFVKN